MAFRRRRSTFRGSTGSLGWIRWNWSGEDRTLGLGRCLRPLPGFRILGRVALETLLDCLVEKHVSGRAAQAAMSDDNRIGKGCRPLFTRRRRCGISAVLTRHKRFENSTARISPRKRSCVDETADRYPRPRLHSPNRPQPHSREILMNDVRNPQNQPNPAPDHSFTFSRASIWVILW